MDVTMLSKHDVRQFVELLEIEWLGRDYDLLSRNCCHFSDTFCRGLGVGPLPAWVMNLAGTGASLLNGVVTAVESAQTVAVAAAETAAETAQAAATIVRQ